jgi:hypothetical protein
MLGAILLSQGTHRAQKSHLLTTLPGALPSPHHPGVQILEARAEPTQPGGQPGFAAATTVYLGDPGRGASEGNCQIYKRRLIFLSANPPLVIFGLKRN